MSRLIFFVVGVFFAMFVFLALRTGTIREGRTGPDYVSDADYPVRFWLVVGACVILSIVGFTGAFVKGRHRTD